MTRKIGRLAAVALLALGGLGAGLLWAGEAPPPRDREITVTARQYAYDPPVIRVNKGDRITLKLVASDVTHGFFLEGHDLDVQSVPENPMMELRRPSEGEEYTPVEDVSFVADTPGKFRYRCSTTCGAMHPFMQGELVVEPNRAYPASVGLSIGLVLASLLYLATKDEEREGEPEEEEEEGR